MAKLKQSAIVVKKPTPIKPALKSTKASVQPKPAKVTVGRLKEVRDSLYKSSEDKGKIALSKMMPFGSPRGKTAKKSQQEDIKAYTDRSIVDKARADRYSSVISKASKKKK